VGYYNLPEQSRPKLDTLIGLLSTTFTLILVFVPLFFYLPHKLRYLCLLFVVFVFSVATLAVGFSVLGQILGYLLIQKILVGDVSVVEKVEYGSALSFGLNLCVLLILEALCSVWIYPRKNG
jgi:hypothetical protein